MQGNRRKRIIYRVLVIEDNPDVQDVLRKHLEKDDYEVLSSLDAGNTFRLIEDFQPNVILLDIMLPGISGIDILKTIRKKYSDIPTIIITGDVTVSNAVECMRLGAYDFITKPIDFTRLAVSVRNAVEFNRLTNRYSMLESMHEPYEFDGMVGVSAQMQMIYQLIRNVARTDATAFIIGESGTGKELIARSIHQNSARASKPIVPINCAAIPHELLESELFGHEKGAFTGAHKRRPGSFESANGGTVFLDEICEMPMDLQAKLLRFIQEKKFMRVGGREEIDVDVRIIAATNKTPLKEIQEGRFRDDLYYRLLVVPIEVPPLRERREDIPILAMSFLERFTLDHGRKFFEFSPEAMKLLINYSWKGNVRELENVIESIVVLHDSRIVYPKHLPKKLVDHVPEYPEADKVEIHVKHLVPEEDKIIPLREVEKRTIEKALMACDGNVIKAARKLRLGQATVYRKIKTYGISV